MTTPETISFHSASRAFRRALNSGTALARLMVGVSAIATILSGPASAEDSTWLEMPTDGNYNDAVNWSPNSVPDSSLDRAVFGQSNTTNIMVTANIPVGSWIFTADASNYAFMSTETLNLLGDGFVINGGSVEYTNGVGGILHFLHQSSAGSASIVNNWTLTFNNESTANSANITNDGVVTFLENSSAGSATVLNASLVRFYDNATAGTAAIQNDGQLYFNDASTAGTATILNNATQVFLATSSAGNAQITNNASLAFTADSTTANATITNNWDIDFIDTSSAANATITNFETLEFGDASTAGNAAITNNHLLGFSGTSSAASATITNLGTLVFVSASSAGNARIINTGTLDISGLLSPNTTTGSIEGEGLINLGSRGLLTGLNGLSTEFSGILSGVGGALGKVGEGTLTLSGANTYTGVTEIIEGTLIVDGSIASSSAVAVNAGASLGGNGFVGTTLVGDGGTVAPGNSIGSIGMLSVIGDITFGADSIYEVETDSIGQSDYIHASGMATLNGGMVEIVPFPDYAIDTQYIILTAAGGVNGTFDDIDFAQTSLFLTPTLAHGANDVYFTIAQTAGFDSAALTPNQIAAAGAAQSLGGGELFNAIALLGTEDDARAAFDSLSGEILASAKAALIEDSRFVREAANARLRAGFGDAVDEGVEFWAHGFGATGRTNGDGNAATLDRSIGGLLVGADGEVFDNWRFGLLAGYSHSNFDVDDRASSGSGGSYHLGAYGGTEWQNWALRFGGAYSWHDLDIDRTAAFTGVSDNLSSSYSAGMGQLFAEFGYGIDVGSTHIEPFANLAYVNLSTDGFTENGGASALTSADSNTDAILATLGLRAEADMALGEMSAKLRGTIGYRHAFTDLPTSTHAFVAGGDAFTVAGVPLAGHSLVLDGGVDINIAPDVAVGLAYSGQFGSGFQSHAAKADLTIKF